MVRRTKADALHTRNQILDAAEQVFISAGVARTSLQDIATQAGVTRGAIYWHFQDKAEVFTAMMDRVLMPCECAMNQIPEHVGTDPMTQVEAMALLPLVQLAKDAHLQRVFTIAMHMTEYTADMLKVQDRHLEGVNQFLAALAERLDHARRLGHLAATADSQALARALFSLVDGLMHNWTLQPERFDLLAVGQPAVACFLRGARAG